MRTRARLLLGLVAALMLAGCDRTKKADGPVYAPQSSETAVTQFTFGVIPALTPAKVVMRFQPLIDQLNTALIAQKMPGISLQVAKDHDDFDRRLNDHSFSVAVVSGVTAIEAEPLGYRIFAKQSDDKNFSGVFLVPKASDIRVPADLKGKIISFPAESVMSGSMMTRLYLHDAGLDRDRDYQAIYCETYDSAVLTLASGRSAAAAVGLGPWGQLARERPDLASRLTVAFQTKPLIQLALIASPRLSQDAVREMTKTLIHLSESDAGRAALLALNFSGFETADSTTYQPVRQFLATYRQAFGEKK